MLYFVLTSTPNTQAPLWCLTAEHHE